MHKLQDQERAANLLKADEELAYITQMYYWSKQSQNTQAGSEEGRSL